jgi:hypothetical protein
VRIADQEALAIIRLAYIWAPFGGPPDEETMPTFGLTRHTFIARMWRAVDKIDCDAKTLTTLRRVYTEPVPRPNR